MRCIASRILLAAGIFLLASQAAWATTDEQLLPPMEPGTTNNCNVSGHPNNVLMLYDNGTGGNSAINCNLNFKADPSGNVTANSFTGNSGTLGSLIVNGTLSVNGSGTALTVPSNALLGSLQLYGESLGTLNGSDSDTLVQLNQLGNCTSDQVLTKNSAGQFQCTNYANAASLGTYAFPSCPGGALDWNDTGNNTTSGFVCYTPAPPPPPISTGCSTGVMYGISSGSANCEAVAAANTSCTAGMYVTGEDSSGNPVCTTPPQYWTLNGVSLYNNVGTNVGINTTTPGGALDVEGENY
jgi:hypothetical protein